jgi:hypothetical protein
VMAMVVVSETPGTPPPLGAGAWVEAPLVAEERLHHLPLGEGTTSFYYEKAPVTGYVKGAWKPWETVLMGWWAFDTYVGQDKDYGEPANPFYTSLKPWARDDSDMGDFPRFLRYWGWRL